MNVNNKLEYLMKVFVVYYWCKQTVVLTETLIMPELQERA
jgi:hypothetical protein